MPGYVLIRILFHQMLVYRKNFVFNLIYLFANFIFIIYFWECLFTFVEIDQWSIQDIGLYSIMVNLAASFIEIFFGLTQLPELILRGEFDYYLCKPGNVFFKLIYQNMNILYVLQGLILNGVMFIVCITVIPYSFTISEFIFSLLLLVEGVVIYELFMVTIIAFSFRLEKIEWLINSFWTVSELKQYPASLFNRTIQNILLVVLPISIMYYYPTAVLIGKVKMTSDLFLMIQSILFLMFMLAYLSWTINKKKFTSNGG